MLLSSRSILSEVTKSKNVYHEHGRHPVIIGTTFIHNGYPYAINSTLKSGVRLDILTAIANELDAMQESYSRVFLSRFDLRLPTGTPVETSNTWMSQLFKTLRERLKSKNGRPKGIAEPIINFAYGWVREKEKAKQVHYHCWIALPQRQVRKMGTQKHGIGGLITEIWMNLTGGEHTLVELPKARGEYPTHYIIKRGEPATLEGPILWLSYLAKERGKYQTGKGDRIHSTSKLSSKK